MTAPPRPTLRVADGSSITLDLTPSGRFARLTVRYHGEYSPALMDAGELRTLARRCVELAELLATQQGEGGVGPDHPRTD